MPGGARRDRVPPIRNYTIDLTVLDEREQLALNKVIEKDLAVSHAVDQRVTEIRREIQLIRKAGALRTGDKQNRICARCKYSFWPVVLTPFNVLLDTGARCMSCRFRVCKKCRFRQVNNQWLCSLCLKQRQEKWLTGEWLSGGSSKGLVGSDLLRASLRDRAHFKAKEETKDKRKNSKQKSFENDVDCDTSHNKNNAQSTHRQINDRNKCLSKKEQKPQRNSRSNKESKSNCGKKWVPADSNTSNCITDELNPNTRGRALKRKWRNKHSHQDRSRSKERQKQKEKFEKILERRKKREKRKPVYSKAKISHISNDSSDESCNQDCNVKIKSFVQLTDKQKDIGISRSKNQKDNLKSKCSKKPFRISRKENVSLYDNYNDSISQNRLTPKIKSKRNLSILKIPQSIDNKARKDRKTSLRKHQMTDNMCRNRETEDTSVLLEHGFQMDENFNFTAKSGEKIKAQRLEEKRKKAELKKQKLLLKKKREQMKKEQEEYRLKKKEADKGFSFLKRIQDGPSQGPQPRSKPQPQPARSPAPAPAPAPADDDSDDEDVDDVLDADDVEDIEDVGGVDSDGSSEVDEKWHLQIQQYGGRPEGSYDVQSVGSQTWQRHRGGWHAWCCPFCRMMCEYGREFG